MYSKVNRTSWMIYMVFGNSKYNRSSWKSKQKMHCFMHLCNKELHIVIMLYKCSLLLFSKSENYLLFNYDCTSYVLLGFRNTKINSLLKMFKIIQLILDNVKLHRIWKMLFLAKKERIFKKLCIYQKIFWIIFFSVPVVQTSMNLQQQMLAQQQGQQGSGFGLPTSVEQMTAQATSVSDSVSFLSYYFS